ncbi:hypothetical protein DB30_00974 [Enhygromyxa salina]|uniref:VWFA domain-containing protein n=1 Tax=Enhygromyxa salina TaxID=215803 RepID=A0A0C2CNQ2_9BACT|nr:hypothetical protein [Enhygromyxa salina]KIG12856.1 hypothetical protein DB30_00974 [Enhygromyxa salina]
MQVPVTNSTVVLATLLGLVACGEAPREPAELVHVSTASDSFPLVGPRRKVDILFVIDNSSSMAEEQSTLAANFGAFIEVLEDEGARVDYRVAITTTDNGNPACDPQLTTPEFGALVMHSCEQHLEDFVANMGEDLDVRDVGCRDSCTLDADALALLPTTTALDDVPGPRPWIERINGKTNLPLGTNMADAFACFGPQGIGGCSFESPLEAMAQALYRSYDVDDPSAGFLRHDAVLAIIFVTDEVDCSHAEAGSALFEVDAPASAVCWNAGVSCEGDPAHYDSCEPVNKSTQGSVGVDDADAVLRPMSRYIGLLEGIEREKQNFDPTAEVVVGLIGGVGSSGEPFYAEVGDSDPEFQDRFGIGPGCVRPNPEDPDRPKRALPPVRLRELVEAFTPGNMFSICDWDYTDALGSFLPNGWGQLTPACYGYCAEDTDPTTDVLEPSCVVEERPLEGGEGTWLSQCKRDAGGYVIEDGDFVMPSDDVDVCFAMLTDPHGTTSATADDISAECLDRGHNLEFTVARRPGVPGVAASRLVTTCTLSNEPAVSCPGLNGT